LRLPANPVGSKTNPIILTKGEPHMTDSSERNRSSPHADSAKDEGRIRVDELTIALPQDLKTKITYHNERLRIKSEKKTMFRAIELGLRVMKIEEIVTETLLNTLEQKAALMVEQVMGSQSAP
jgi:hypothetical protein